MDGDGPRAGSIADGWVTPLAAADLLGIIGGDAPQPAGDRRPLDSVELLAPLVPGKLLGIGLNYSDHAAETGATPPAEPLIFAKLASSVTGPRADVRRPAYTVELDYEAELAVVIGRSARDASLGSALDFVFGYAAMNDVSARDRQRAEPQWVRAKGGDTFGPFGPWIVPAAEIGDPQTLAVRTWVNDELRQDGTTADMIHPVAALVAYCSAQFTLDPGDVITTGTPAGVGLGHRPPRFLQLGDVVRVEVERIGVLENRVVAG